MTYQSRAKADYDGSSDASITVLQTRLQAFHIAESSQVHDLTQDTAATLYDAAQSMEFPDGSAIGLTDEVRPNIHAFRQDWVSRLNH